MSTAAIIWIIIASVSLLTEAHLHGQPRTGKHNFFVSVVGIGMAAGLLYWGGFFSGQ